jgi:hypothetical protein
MAIDSTDLPIAAMAGEAGPHAADAFALLADETRLAVLLALWQAYDAGNDDNSLRFSEIFDRVEYDSPGNLNYHIEKLEGQFLRRREDGSYEIRTTGLKFVRSIIAGSGVDDVTLEPTEIDQPCPFCDAPTTVGYQDGTVTHACTSCPGAAPDADADGALSVVPFDPAGLRERGPEEVWAASVVAALRGARSMFQRLCPACSGAVDGWFECPDEWERPSESRRLTVPVRAHFQCRTCRKHTVDPPRGLALFHPAVVSFYGDHDVSTHVSADDFRTVRRFYALMNGHDVELLSAEPIRVAVTVRCDDDQLRVTFDETVRAVDVS